MKRPEGSPLIYLASTSPTQTVPSRSQAELRSVLAALENCRATLAISAEHETGDLVSMAILQLRMKLEGVSESELRLLCENLGAGQAEVLLSPKRPRERRRRRPPALRLVKA